MYCNLDTYIYIKAHNFYIYVHMWKCMSTYAYIMCMFTAAALLVY